MSSSQEDSSQHCVVLSSLQRADLSGTAICQEQQGDHDGKCALVQCGENGHDAANDLRRLEVSRWSKCANVRSVQLSGDVVPCPFSRAAMLRAGRMPLRIFGGDSSQLWHDRVSCSPPSSANPRYMHVSKGLPSEAEGDGEDASSDAAVPRSQHVPHSLNCIRKAVVDQRINTLFHALGSESRTGTSGNPDRTAHWR